MFGSQILDIAIAMIMFFLFVSLICSALREGLEAVFKVRAMQLERGIRELLADPKGNGITKTLFDHPMISSLFNGTYDPAKLKKGLFERADVMNLTARRSLPSYLPASNFAIALLDTTVNGALKTGDAPTQTAVLSLDAVRSSIKNLPNDYLRRAVLGAVDRAQGDLAQAQKNLEDWFNSAMDRVSGYYKRYTQWILLLLGLAAAIFLNLDSFAALDAFSTDKSVRDGLVAAADVELKQAAPGSNGKANADLLKSLEGDFRNANLQMGWQWDAGLVPLPQQKNPDVGLGLFDWLKIVLGWFVTALAVTLGAPFWFDLLGTFMKVRSSLKPDDDNKTADAPVAATPSQPTPQPVVFTPNRGNAGSPQEGTI